MEQISIPVDEREHHQPGDLGRPDFLAPVLSRRMSRFLAPEIESPLGDVRTDRMLLRRFDETDLDGLARVFAKAEVWEFPYGRSFTRQETSSFLDAQLAEWDECGFGCWIAVLDATQEPIGYVGLSVPMFLPEILPAVEIGWRFDPDVWGRGSDVHEDQGSLVEQHARWLSQAPTVAKCRSAASANVTNPGGSGAVA